MSVTSSGALLTALQQKYTKFDIAKYPLVIDYAVSLVKDVNTLSLLQKRGVVTDGVKQFIQASDANLVIKMGFVNSVSVLVNAKMV